MTHNDMMVDLEGIKAVEIINVDDDLIMTVF